MYRIYIAWVYRHSLTSQLPDWSYKELCEYVLDQIPADQWEDLYQESYYVATAFDYPLA